MEFHENGTGTDALNSDTDGDTMADGWEINAGFDPLSNDSAGDADGDLFNNRDEYIADTDPNNANDFFRMAGLDPASSATIVFNCSPGRVYSLQHRASLATGQWFWVEGQTNVPGNASGTMTLIDTNAAPVRFYRLEVELP